jgi:NAD(P)-dependent dehydrogenase (short-subunit alcohol dehydrogenase family)
LLFAQARRQFDTNLFGLARLTQLIIPGMRQAGGGTIINLSPVFGRFAFPAGTSWTAQAMPGHCRGREPNPDGGAPEWWHQRLAVLSP